VHAENTPYQRIVVTRWKDDLRLHLNNNLQFSSRDEYRYHEALVHPGLATLPAARPRAGARRRRRAGAARDPQVPADRVGDAGRPRPGDDAPVRQRTALRKLNQDALHSPKVQVVNADALQWLEENDDRFDFVVVDFPDPSNFAIGKLYSAAFYRLLEKHLNGTRWRSSSRPRRSTPDNPSGASSRRWRASA
jgi:spermidine synthase